MILTHVWFGPGDRGDGYSWSDDAGNVEVGQVDMAARVQQHVGRLHVTMDDLMVSQVLQGQAQLSHVEPDPSHRESPLLLQMVA